jgi:hypothetical protein
VGEKKALGQRLSIPCPFVVDVQPKKDELGIFNLHHAAD